MQCPTPISIKDKSENNPLGLDSIRIDVPCGRCGICKKNRRAQWSFRLREQLKDSYNAKFLTLTYSDENLPYNLHTGEITLVKKHLQDFIKRLRESSYRRTGARNLRYYSVGEYGSETDRPHYHALIYNIDKYNLSRLNTIWGYGFTGIGTVSPASIHYVTKYHVNRNTYADEEDGRLPEFAIMSQGLGKGYIDRNKQYHLDTGNTFVYMDGFKVNMPRYYKQKIFSENQIKLYSERNLQSSREAEKEEAERLLKLGYDDPYHEMWRRSIQKAKKIKSKSQEKDKL